MSVQRKSSGPVITMTFSPDGSVVIHGVSVLDDLWEDYLFFRGQAEATSPQEDLKLYKRFVRAALLALFNYFEGVLNKWVHMIDDNAGNFVPIGKKLSIVRRAVKEKIQRRGNPGSRPGASDRWLDFEGARRIRNAISHLDPTADQFAIYERLVSGSIFHEADEIVTWVNDVKSILGFDAHVDMQKQVEDLATRLGG